MTGSPNPWRVNGGAVVLAVHLTPRAAHDRIDGRADLPSGAVIKARVRAVPADGKANAALEALIAAWLGVGKRSVEVTGGQTSRLKSVTVSPAGDALLAHLKTHLASE